jgi:hypothetical protein
VAQTSKSKWQCRCHCFAICGSDRFSALGAHTCVKNASIRPSKYKRSAAVQISSVVVVARRRVRVFSASAMPLLRKQVAASIFDETAAGAFRKKNDFDFEPHTRRVIGFYVAAAFAYQSECGIQLTLPLSLCKSADPKSKRCSRLTMGPIRWWRAPFHPSFLCCLDMALGRAPSGSAKCFRPGPHRQREPVCVCCQSCVKKLAAANLRETLKCCQPIFNMFRCARGNIGLMNNPNFPWV